jgi:hypothetical protein
MPLFTKLVEFRTRKNNFDGFLPAVRCSMIIRYQLCLCASWDSMGVWETPETAAACHQARILSRASPNPQFFILGVPQSANPREK